MVADAIQICTLGSSAPSSDHVLHTLVARALGWPPARVTIVRDARGRPTVEGHGSVGLSLTHRDGITLVAIDPHGRVGLDLEARSAASAIAGMAATFLPPARVAALRDEGAAPESPRWVDCWTELEACAKLAGTGLGDLDPESAARLVAVPHGLIAFDVGPGHRAALVHEPGTRQVRFLDAGATPATSATIDVSPTLTPAA